MVFPQGGSFVCSTLVTASTDKTLALWDVDAGTRIKKLKSHNGFVNSCHIARRGPQLICSGSDDGTIKVCCSGAGGGGLGRGGTMGFTVDM